MSNEFRPIGYWIKEVDRLVEEGFAGLLAGEGLTRRHWQVLNTLAGGTTSQDGLDRALAPFLDGAGNAPVVADLEGRGWVRREGGIALTATGSRAHAALSERVGTHRRRMTEGITAEEYASVVGVLERMAANLAVRQLGIRSPLRVVPGL
ncbi:MAG TPA: MarR family transcriptional regulator [Actinophytocola sp.]|uniref:MarR family winged helix-turn-helix transcriptional regulator n=1 Tax=Actinophytocola sp. TaxID=1872138 RepID=UPI002DF91BD5|nr:MarR family transcriptional regulator [Actinophytocola sp.]